MYKRQIQFTNDEKDRIFKMKDDDGRRYQGYIPVVANRFFRKPEERLIYEYKGFSPEYGWIMTRDKLEKLDKEGYIWFSKTGHIYRKSYEDEHLGRRVNSIWIDVGEINGNSSERTGYPTQKPLKLLERMINTSSNEDDTILDPFCGSGTSLVAAERLNCRWIGIDSNDEAIRITKARIEREYSDIEIHLC